MAHGLSTATDNLAIDRFRAGYLIGPALDVAIEAILGCRYRPDRLMAGRARSPTDPSLRRSCGTPLPYGSEILIRLENVIDANALLGEIETGGFVGNGTVVTLFEADLDNDDSVTARGCGVL